MPGFRSNLSQLGEQLGPAPSWGQFAGEVAGESLLNVPPMLGVAGLLGAGLGAGAGSLTGHGAARGATVGVGAGLGGIGGMAAGSALAQTIARLGGPMIGLNPNQTHALMNRADIGGSVAGSLLGAGLGGYLGHKKNEKEAMFGMGDPGLNAIPGTNLVKRRTSSINAIEKLRQAHAAARSLGVKQPPADPAVAPANKPQELGSWMTPEMRAAMEANMKSGSLRKIAADIMDSPLGYAGKHMVEAGKGYNNMLPYAALSGVLGGGAGYLLGDPTAGVGAGAGAVIGGAGGNILGTGLGALGGAALGHASGITGPALQKLMDQWAHGGGHAGNVLGSLYGGYKGMGLARRVSQDREGKEAAARAVEKMAHIAANCRLCNPSAFLDPKSVSTTLTPALADKAAAAGALPARATPPVTPTSNWFSGMSMPGGWKSKSLIYGGLAAGGLAGLGNIMYHGGRQQVADRDTDLRNMEGRDFLGKQHEMELERQHTLLERIKHPMDYYDPSTRAS